MNPEIASQVTNPPPEAPAPGRPAETGEARKKKSGLLGRFIRVAQWLDRGLDLEGRDTSDWNIYYYYYRQVAQHHALIKLKHMKWIALIFQLYFFGMLALTQIRFLFLFDRTKGFTKEAFIDMLGGYTAMVGMSANIYILPALLFVPVFMVVPAFRLRNKAQGLMTSRAKEPPLLAHLVQYTSNKGLVQGVLQSLIFTWKRFVILLLPAIVVALLLLTTGALIDHTETAYKLAFAAPAGVALSVLTLSLFFVMQPFCYRWDTLLVMVCIGIETVMIVILGFDAKNSADFWICFSACYIPSCLFGCAYFPLAAADTGEYGLGKRTSKGIRILLYATAGVFLACLLSTNAFPGLLNEAGHAVLDDFKELSRTLLLYFILGLCVCVSCLLVTSVSVTSPLAERQRRIRAKGPFLRKLFDPASPFSLIPILALELIALAAVSEWIRPFTRFMNIGRTRSVAGDCVQIARVVWTAMHFSLAFVSARQLRKPERKDPWLSHLPFNRAFSICLVAVGLPVVLTGMNLSGRAGNETSMFLYVVSIIILFAVSGLLYARTKNFSSAEDMGSPAEQDNDKEEAS